MGISAKMAVYGLTPALCVLALAWDAKSGAPQAMPNAPIDRHALVSRHNVVLTAFNGNNPLQVGNGEFAFGMDITGLQTFAAFNTMSQWGWHSVPLPNGKSLSDYHRQPVETHGKMVNYPLEDPKEPELSDWLAGNPHRINLGRVGLVLTKKDGTPATCDDIKSPHQELDLWSGVVTSQFTLEGIPVTVATASHSSRDAIAATVDSPLVKEGRIAVFVDFPGDDPSKFNNFVGNWDKIDTPETTMVSQGQRADFSRRFEGDAVDSYHVALSWQGKATVGKPAPADKSLPLVIQKAEFGAGAKVVDVTAAVTKLVKDGQPVHAGLTLGGDPAPQTQKRLRITYTLGGSTIKGEAIEGQDFKFRADEGRERYTLQPAAGQDTFAFVCDFSPKALPKNEPTATQVLQDSRQGWARYWKSGGAIDLSQSKDPRWQELERRIVLSQYLLKVNEAGSLPPQESGLVNNGWYGRFHYEMIWWHSAHWALWNRWPEMEGNLSVYQKFLAQRLQITKEQGYQGARWPKCTGPDGVEWPNRIHATLIWEQPHPLFFAEMDYRAHPTRATLQKWAPIVEATADFMASFAYFDPKKGEYVLGPPITLVSENTDWLTTQNPTYELSYWRTGLRIAQQWRQRLGEKPNEEWGKVLKGLAPLPVQDGLYVTHEGIQDMWTKWNYEHPALIGAYGMLPGDGVDKDTMRRTFDKVSTTWNFGRTWGWDFPMLAMCAAKVGEPDKAVDMLMTPAGGFKFDERGLATGGPFPYFPSNGGLLYAVAQMAAGWDGAPKRNAPGFPDDGQWTVRWEGLSPSM